MQSETQVVENFSIRYSAYTSPASRAPISRPLLQRAMLGFPSRSFTLPPAPASAVTTVIVSAV